MKNAYVIMTRIPVAGKTKTRMMPNLNGEQCAELHSCLLKDLFETTDALKDEIDIFVAYSDEGNINLLTSIAPKFIKLFPQQGNNLGKKMNNAINYLLNIGYDKVVLTGSDIPNISSDIIENSFLYLNNWDIVIGSTYDGGYYLIGCSESIDDILLSPISWGQETVFQRTLTIIHNKNKNYKLIEPLQDIDTIEDLLNFKKSSIDNSYTLDFINNIKASSKNNDKYIILLFSFTCLIYKEKESLWKIILM